MNVGTFLQQISDEQGPLQSHAVDKIERMTIEDWNELAEGMQRLLARGGEFHPTNRDAE